MANEAKVIYIADDDDNIRQVVRTFMASDGYQVEDFPTGDLLLELFLAESLWTRAAATFSSKGPPFWKWSVKSAK